MSLKESNMPMKYASKAFRRREKEIQKRNSKNKNQLDSDEDDNGNKLNDYEQKRLQNIVDRKNKISELKVNFTFNTTLYILQNIFVNLLNCMVNLLLTRFKLHTIRCFFYYR